MQWASGVRLRWLPLDSDAGTVAGDVRRQQIPVNCSTKINTRGNVRPTFLHSSAAVIDSEGMSINHMATHSGAL